MDQNAPFNPTYSIAALPVSRLPINPNCRHSREGPARAWRRSTRPQDADADLLFVTARAGAHAEYIADPRLHRIARLSRAHRHRRQHARSRRSVRHRLVPPPIPQISPALSPMRQSPPDPSTSPPERRRPTQPSPIPGRGSPSATAATTRSNSTSITASATTSRFAASTPGPRRSTTETR